MYRKGIKVAWDNYVENVINMNFELLQSALTSVSVLIHNTNVANSTVYNDHR